jgi:hypothetical protein
MSIIVFPVVSSAVFLSVGPSLIAVGFGSSFQLLSRGFSFHHNGRGRRPLEEGERRRRAEKEVGKHALLIKLQAWRNGLPRPQVSVCRIHKGETKRLRRREPKNSVKRVHFGTRRSRVSVHASHDALTLCSP